MGQDMENKSEELNFNAATMKKKPAEKALPVSLPYLVCTLAVGLAYVGVRNLEFLSWDDNVYVYENILVRNLSMSGIQDIFRNFVMGNYHPLVILSYALEYAAVGNAPTLYHLTNLALHLGTSLLVLRLVHQITRNLPLAFLTALFFGVHPLRVESVAWVTERKDVLYGLFYLASLNAWVFWRNSGKWGHWALMVIFFIASCLSKGQAVTLPAALFLLELLRGESWKNVLKQPGWLATLIPAIGFGILAVYAQKFGGNIRSSEVFGPLEQMFIGCTSLLFYFQRYFLPLNLVPFYPYPEAPLSPIWYAAPMGVLALAGSVVFFWKKEKTIAFCLAFYLVHLLPVAQFLPVGNAIAADRYFYIPGLGLAWISAWALVHFLPLRRALVVGVTLSLVWGVLTWNQVKIWKNTETFFGHIIQSNPNVDFAFVNLGRYLEKQNRKREAVDIYLEGIRHNPDYPDQYNDGGYTLSHLGKYDSARLLLKKALTLAPDMAEAYNNLGYTFSMMQQFDSSEVYLKESIRLNPKNETAYNNLGSTYSMMGRMQDAIQNYQKAISLKPDYADAFNNMGSCYGMSGNNAKALEHFQKAISLNPDFGGAWFNAGIALQTGGESEKALIAYKRAARLGHEPAMQYLRSQGQTW